MFVDRRGENLEWLQAEMGIDDIDGIVVFDFRNINKDKRDYNESGFL